MHEKWVGSPECPYAPSRRTLLKLLSTGTFCTTLFGTACTSSSYVAPNPSPTMHTASTVRILTGFSDRIGSLSWSPDGKRFVSGSWDYSVKVWDAATGALLFTCMPAHSSVVTSVAWSFDGKRLVSGSWDRTVKTWDAATGRLLTSYNHGTPHGHGRPVNSVAWSYDDRHLASAGSNYKVTVWDTVTGSNLETYQNDPHNVHAVAWSPFNLLLLASGTDDNKVYIHNSQSNTTILTYHGHRDQVNALAWSPKKSGKSYIASGSGEYDPDAVPPTNPVGDTSVQVWDTSSGKTLYVYKGHNKSITAIAWSPDGNFIASGSADHTVHVWSALTGQLVTRYTRHTDEVTAVAWSPDGTTIASGSADRSIHLWRIIPYSHR